METAQESNPHVPSLTNLPAELRWEIWDAVAQTDDLKNLAMVNRIIRHDVLSRVPGASYSCTCPVAASCSCGASFEVRRLSAIVDSDCSETHWLKFIVQVGKKSPARTWCVSDLDSRFARALRYYRPRELEVEFQSPGKRQSDVTSAILILQAKLFDVCKVLTWCRPQREQHLQISFTNPHGRPSSVRDSFWERSITDSRWFYWQDMDQIRAAHRRNFNTWTAERRPLFYECLLLPFCLHWAWRNATVTFDQDIAQVGLGVTWNEHITPNGRRDFRPSLGYESLVLTAWAYMETLIRSGTLDRWENTQARGSLTPYFPQYEVNAEAWEALKGQQALTHQRHYHFQAFHRHLCQVIYLSHFLVAILDLQLRYQPASVEPLRAHILRTRNASKSSAFSRLHPRVEGEWRWNLESARQAYMWWAVGEAENPSWLSWREQYEALWPPAWPRSCQDIERRFYSSEDRADEFERSRMG